MISLILLVSVILSVIYSSYSFNLNLLTSRRINNGLSMEYIPDGLSKQQWELLKKKEIEEIKSKGNLGVLGVNKFKSRSLQAWQESGGKHLFPVDPKKVPYEERPYMQRKNGDWEGNDLKSKGLSGKGQGTPYERLKTDNIYESDKKAGKLNSISIFGGAALPWTNEQASKFAKTEWSPSAKQGERGVAGKKLSPKEIEELKAKLVKPVITNKVSKDEPEKKKIFGLF